ncbi:ABC transporter substrate-binding protein [Aquamicrobium segne]|uniref:ABC transporter substrate-binding protein n=1 Tax=Aquamicrobium segne TaxID=469547 RepID=A0ABW0GSW1_9HYPH
MSLIRVIMLFRPFRVDKPDDKCHIFAPFSGRKHPSSTMTRRHFTRRAFALSGLALFAPTATFAGGLEVATAFGPMSIPAAPERIVALDAAAAVAANYGLKPVGVTAVSRTSLTEAGAQTLRDIPVIGASTYGGQLRYEAILALRPDLIVGMVRGGADHSALYRKLSAIAPTVLIQSEGAGALLETSDALAAAMGLEAQARSDRDVYNARVAACRERWSDALQRGPLAVISGRDRQILIHSPISWTGRIFRDIGAALPPVARTDEANGVQLSYEEVDELADVQGFVYPTLDGQPSPEVQPVLNLPGFRRLPAVRLGRLTGLSDIWPEMHLTANRFLDGLDTLMNKLDAG